jgi:hypothetical protein
VSARVRYSVKLDCSISSAKSRTTCFGRQGTWSFFENIWLGWLAYTMVGPSPGLKQLSQQDAVGRCRFNATLGRCSRTSARVRYSLKLDCSKFIGKISDHLFWPAGDLVIFRKHLAGLVGLPNGRIFSRFKAAQPAGCCRKVPLYRYVRPLLS